MALIVRPTKTGGSSDYVDGNIGLAAEFNGDANNIYNDYNGNITDANIAASAAIQGSKLAAAPNGVPTANINDKAVTDTKLANDVALDALRAVSTNSIKDANVTLPKVKITTVTQNLTSISPLAAGGSARFDLGKSITTTIALMVYFEGTSANLIGVDSIQVGLQRDTTTNTWWLSIRNNFSAPVGLTATSCNIKFLET